MNNVSTSGDIKSDKSLSIVGIGVSAGNVKALKTLFGHDAPPERLTYIIVTHFHPDKKSNLAGLLQKVTKLPVTIVEEVTYIRPGHIYVIVPGQNLEVTETHLHVHALEKNRRYRAPINHLFKSLARVYGKRCAGLILTGVGSDGTLGLKEIKAYGGLTVVQDPEDAEFDGMPVSALKTGIVDIVLPLREMAGYLSHIARMTAMSESSGKLDGPAVDSVIKQLRLQTGKNFSQLKNEVLGDRIYRR
ncbi:MAG: chemotaxis protein CheB, partial [Cyclobacteriaceae bacterium]